jgi:hypothetical protein
MDRDEPIVEQAGSAAPPIEVLVVPTPALDANQGQITNSSSRDAGAHEADEALDPSTKPTDLVITDLDIEADDVPSKRRRRTRTGKRAGSTQKGQSGYDLDDVLPPR